MKDLLFSFTVAVLFSVSLLLSYGFSENNPSAENSHYKEGSLLWEVKKRGSNITSYIFGTTFDAGKEFIDTSVVINNLLDSVKMLICETDTGSSINEDWYMEKLSMKDGDYYEFDSLHDEKKLRKFLQEMYKMPFLPTFKPIFYVILIQILPPSIDIENYEFEERIYLDQYLRLCADQKNKTIIELETLREQVSILTDSFSIKGQCNLLMNMINNYENTIQGNPVFNSCYYSQDLDCINDALFPYGKGTEFARVFFQKKNLRWINKILDVIETTPSFIAVGVGHLLGQDGIIELLERNGYVVNPVKF